MSTAGELEVLEANLPSLTKTISHESLVDRSRPNNSSQNAPHLTTVLTDQPSRHIDSEGADALSPSTAQASDELSSNRVRCPFNTSEIEPI